MEPGYSIDQMLELRRLLSKYVGEEKASEWVKNRFADKVHYNLPAIKMPNGRTRNTAYGTLENLDVRPERYMPPEGTKVTTVPYDQWKFGDANGVFQFDKGVTLPEKPWARTRPEATLAHEGQHVLDFMYEDNFMDRGQGSEGRKKQSDQKIKDSGLLSGEIYKNMVKHLGSERGITEQPQSYEVIPQLRSYEAQLPAWKRLQATEFFKNLSNDAKALIMRKFFPTPKGYDAITGLSYD